MKQETIIFQHYYIHEQEIRSYLRGRQASGHRARRGHIPMTTCRTKWSNKIILYLGT